MNSPVPTEADYPWGRVIELFSSLLYAAAIAFLLPRIFMHMDHVQFKRGEYSVMNFALAFIVLHIAIDWLSHTRRAVSISNDTGGVLVLRFAAWTVAICFLSIGHIELFDNVACRFATGERSFCAGTTEYLLRDSFSMFFLLTFVLNFLIMISQFNLDGFRSVWLLVCDSLKGDINKNLFSSGFGDISKESKLASAFRNALDLRDSVPEGRPDLKKFMRSAFVTWICSIISVHFLLSGFLAAFILHYNSVQNIDAVSFVTSSLRSQIFFVILIYFMMSLLASWFFIQRWIYSVVPIGFYLIAYSYIASFELVYVLIFLMAWQIIFSIGVLLLDPPALANAES